MKISTTQHLPPVIGRDEWQRCRDDVYLTYDTDYRGTETMDAALGVLDRTIFGR